MYAEVTPTVQPIQIETYALTIGVSVGQRELIALAKVIHAMDLVGQQNAVVDWGESRVLEKISIIALMAPVCVEKQVSAVREQQTHAAALTVGAVTCIRAIVVARREALVRKMRCVLMALVTVTANQRAKSPPTPATEPTAYVMLAPNVPERM